VVEPLSNEREREKTEWQRRKNEVQEEEIFQKKKLDAFSVASMRSDKKL